MTRYIHPNDAIREAAQRLLRVSVHRVPIDPTPADALQLKDDLMEIAAILDPVIESFGTYAQSAFGPVEMKVFRNVIRDALEGDAEYEIERAGEDYEEMRR